MFGEALTIAKTIFSTFWTPIKAGTRRVHIWTFRWRTRKLPLPEGKAKQIAYSVLAGEILKAISFRNIVSSHLFIACLRKSSERDFDLRVYVLEQAGHSFRMIWKSEVLYAANPTFEVEDVDGDGNREVVLTDQSCGTGGGSRSLMIYSIVNSRLFSVTESLNWQNRAGPISPEIEIEPSDDPKMVRILEEVAKRRGFLQPDQPVDFELPEFSIQRWHKENGTCTSGAIRIHYYSGYPPCQASVVTTLDTGSILWISFFKGPLVAYERLNDRHFVAFSPSWSYNWAKCLVFDGKNIWFGSHIKKGLTSFVSGQNVLQTYESFRGESLPEVEKLEIDDGDLVLNEQIRVPIDALTKVSARVHRLN